MQKVPIFRPDRLDPVGASCLMVEEELSGMSTQWGLVLKTATRPHCLTPEGKHFYPSNAEVDKLDMN